MVTNQKHSSDASSEQEVNRYTEKLAQIFGLNEQNAEMYSTLSGENRALKKQLEDYHSQNSTLERRVKILEKDVGSLKVELEDLESSSSESSSSDSDIDEIVKMIKHQRIRKQIRKRQAQRKVSKEKCISSN
jgi:archaellum component FlaC